MKSSDTKLHKVLSKLHKAIVRLSDIRNPDCTQSEKLCHKPASTRQAGLHKEFGNKTDASTKAFQLIREKGY